MNITKEGEDYLKTAVLEDIGEESVVIDPESVKREVEESTMLLNQSVNVQEPIKIK